MCSKFINQCNVAVKHFGTDFYRGCCNGGITRGHGETDWINYGKKEQMRERGRRSMCLKNNEENPKKQLVSCGNLWNLRAQKSQRSSAALTIYTKCAQHALNFSQYSFCMHLTPKHSANFFITQRHRNISHTHLFFAGLSSQYSLLPFRPWRRNDPSSLWLPFDPEPLSCPLAREPGKKENGYSLASIRFQLSAAIHTKRFFVNKTLDQRINSEYLDTSRASGE